MTIRTQPAKAARSETARRRSTPRPAHLFAQDPPTMAEPKISDMLKDPTVQRLMQSDRVEPNALLSLMDSLRVSR